MRTLPSFKNLVELLQRFNDEDCCRDYVKSVLWKGEPNSCPRCGHTKVYAFKDGRTYKCAGCRKKFNVLTGTIFENTKIPLQKWFAAMFLASSHKRGVSSHQLARDIGVTQTTAYFMLQRIRVMFENIQPEVLEGVCTADETFIGGKNKNRHADKKVKHAQGGRGNIDKISVFGVMQVGGKVKSVAVADVSGKTLVPLVQKHVKPGSTMMTDEWQAYSGLSKDYTHLICDHGRKQYVSDEGATTNPIENYWASVKRAVMGAYYHLSRKHISRYLAEFDYKFNTRGETEHDRFAMTLAHCRGRLRYRELIS
jgi:transposase-like protein